MSSGLAFACYWCEAPAGKPCDYYTCQVAREKKQLVAWRWPYTLSANLALAGALCEAHELGTMDVFANSWRPGCGRQAP